MNVKRYFKLTCVTTHPHSCDFLGISSTMDENPSKDQLLRRIPLDLRIQLRNRLKHSAINYIDNGGLKYRSPECCISNGILLSVVNATENWTVSRKCHGNLCELFVSWCTHKTSRWIRDDRRCWGDAMRSVIVAKFHELNFDMTKNRCEYDHVNNRQNTL